MARLPRPDRRQATRPTPAGISLLIDPAWLLEEHPLTAGETVTESGRPALRVLTTLTRKSAARGPLSGITIPADKVEVTIDLQLGIALAQVWYLEGNPVLRTELSTVTPGADRAVFRIEPPPEPRSSPAACSPRLACHQPGQHGQRP